MTNSSATIDLSLPLTVSLTNSYHFIPSWNVKEWSVDAYRVFSNDVQGFSSYYIHNESNWQCVKKKI